MEDLYSNLDNYEEANVIDELRNENKILKSKVDGFTIAIEKMQNDFDTLSSEFTKLEMNYSSLLKTARAEVERKTQIITNLNMEKDMLVLNSLQNGNQSLLSIRRTMAINNKTKSNKNYDSDSSKSNYSSSKNTKESSAIKDFSCERLEENKPSDDTVRNSKSDNNTLVNKHIENVESCSDKNSDGKDNADHKDGYEGSASAQSGSIKRRRKSMLALSVHDEKYSTDEEWDTDLITKERISKEHSFRKEYFQKEKIKRDFNEKNNRKYSEPNIDDKYYGSHESLRDPRKSRNYRKHEGDKYRSQDKHEYSRKSWRHTSPDRSHRKPPGDYNESHKQRSGHRNRVLESPPSDKYNYKRKMREHCQNIERSTRNKRHYESEKQMTKHKMSSEYEEPSMKRVRSNSFHRHLDEDDNNHSRTNSFHRHIYEDDNKHSRINSFHRHIDEDVDICSRTNSYHRHIQEEEGWYEDINSEYASPCPDLRSCLSPDFLHSDLQEVSNHQIKEIKHTAATQLEDPRMTNKKYVVKSNDDKVTLCTAVGRNVDIELINKAMWNIPQVHIPELLVQKPVEVEVTEINENLVKELYMDLIENPTMGSNLSMESGEITLGAESDPNSLTKELKQKEIENGSRCEKVVKNTQELNKKNEDIPEAITTDHKIPKIKHSVQELNSCNPGDRNATLPHKPNSSEIYKDQNDKMYHTQCTMDFKKIPEILYDHDNFLTKNIKDTIHDIKQRDLQKNNIISSRQIVEGDLELSDETSDNIDLHQLTRIDIEKRILYDPKQCKNDNTVKEVINTENIGLQEYKETELVNKNHKKITKKHHSSIFDIQHDEMKERSDTNKSNEIVIINERQKSNNKTENQLSMIDIQPPEIEKKFVDEYQKTHKKNVQKEEVKSKEKIIVEKILPDERKPPSSSKLNVHHQVIDNYISLEIKEADKNQTTCHMNEPECAMIDIKKQVNDIKIRANTDTNKEKDKNRKSYKNKDITTNLGIQLSTEESKDKNNDIKISNKNEKRNKKKEDQSKIDIQIIEKDMEKEGIKDRINVKNDPVSLIILQQQVEEIKDKCDKTIEIQKADKNKAINETQKHSSKKDKKKVKYIEDKLVKNMEIEKTAVIQRTDKSIEIPIEDKSENILKPKPKKKSHKLKETLKKESLGDSESLQDTVKKRSKKEKDKPKEIKNKFTDLFGDSCSLITPDELGINSGLGEAIVQSSNTYVPIFEDAQDAIDLKEIAKVQLDASIVDVASDEKAPSGITEIGSSSKQNSTASNIDLEFQNNNKINDVSPKVNEDVNLEPLANETDVVKTVVISTGLQRLCSLENSKTEIRHEIVNIDENTHTNYNVMLKSQEFALKALATSTPHKDVHNKVIESEPKVPCIDNSVHTPEQSDTNTLDSQTDVDTDVPDVRIFVRRRRKVIKKPTM